MNNNRKKCYNSIVENSNVNVILVTEYNLKNFIHTDYSLHAGFEYLSATHKSDYLRSYFMHVHGGGYTDIKYCNFNWNLYFDQLINSDKLFSGCPQTSPYHIGYKPVSQFYKELIGVTNFIFKAQTNFTKLWYVATQQKMNEIYDKLILHPGHYHPRAIYGGFHGSTPKDTKFNKSKYPLEWNELLGRIFHKLIYENRGTFFKNIPFSSIKDYM